MEGKAIIKGSWLNLNRACNLRCRWCYASGTGFELKNNMPIELAKNLIDLKYDLGVRMVILLGGEPLVYKKWPEVVNYCEKKGIKSVLVTNGILFSKDKVIDDVLNSPPSWISISLKAYDRQSYINSTGKDVFNEVIKGMRNLSKNNISFDISITFNSLISEDFVSMVRIAYESGASNVVITFCTTVFSDNEPQSVEMDNPLDIVKIFVERYDELHDSTRGRIVIGQSLPFCIWPDDFIQLLKDRDQISFGCVSLQKSGVIFDSLGYVLACNCLYDIKIGKYGTDFTDRESFARFWESESTNQIFDGLSTYPSAACIECADYNVCGGGCPLRWFIYDPAEIIPDKRR